MKLKGITSQAMRAISRGPMPSELAVASAGFETKASTTQTVPVLPESGVHPLTKGAGPRFTPLDLIRRGRSLVAMRSIAVPISDKSGERAKLY
jgi:hypothetical protein